MSTRISFSRVGAVLVPKLHTELVAAGLTIEGVSDSVADAGTVGVDFVSAPSGAQQTTAQGVIDAHNGTDFEQTRTDEARSNMQASFSGIRALPPLDQVTIIFARGLFVEEGGSGAGALAIDTLAEANSTITGSAWWGGMTVAQRAQWNTFLQVLRRILQGLLLNR